MRSKPEAWVPPQPQLQLQAKGWARLKGLRSWLNWLTPLSYRLPVGRQRVLGRTMLLLGDAKETHRVMADEAETHPKHPMTLWLLRPLIGRGVFSVNGEEWRQQRQWVDKARSKRRSAGCIHRCKPPQEMHWPSSTLVRLIWKKSDGFHGRCDCPHDPQHSSGPRRRC